MTKTSDSRPVLKNEAVIVVTNEMTPNRAKSETKGIPAMAHPLNINIAPTMPNYGSGVGTLQSNQWDHTNYLIVGGLNCGIGNKFHYLKTEANINLLR